MKNIQELLNDIQNTWGKCCNSSIGNGRVKRLKIFKDGEFVTDCFGKLNAATLTGCTVSSIEKVLMGRINKTNGYYFVWQDQWNGETERQPKFAKPILQYKDGQLIGEYTSIYDASIKLGIPRYDIGHCVGGKQKTTRGFVFKYK